MSDDRTVELPPSLRAALLDRRGLPRSYELGSAIVVLLVLGAFLFLLPTEWQKCQQLVQNALSTCASTNDGYLLIESTAWWQLITVFVVIWMAAVLAMGVQGGLRWRPHAISPSMERFAGMQPWRLEAMTQSLWSTIVVTLRLIVLVIVGVTWLWWDFPNAVLQVEAGEGPTPWHLLTTGMARGIAVVALAWLVLGLLDYAVRFVSFRRSMRVSTREWRDALRALSGNPEVRHLRREHQQRRRRGE